MTTVLKSLTEGWLTAAFQASTCESKASGISARLSRINFGQD